jgi:hypothetical protein
MNKKERSLASIKREIRVKETFLNQIHAARLAVRNTTLPVAERGAEAAPLAAMLAATPAKRTFRLLAQGDSWFDYPSGTDLIDCLHRNHGHEIVNIAVAGSTLNDEAYGPVPRELFGLPIGQTQSDDPSRIAELVQRILEDKPQALLLSAGGNDIAGDEFFSFINNAQSGLASVNQDVLDGVVNNTFKTAYEYLISTARAAARQAHITMPVFTHGYDYPWPDGRGVISKVGELRAGDQVLCLHHGEVLTVGRIDKDKRQPLALKESQGCLSIVRQPIPIAQLDCKPLISKQGGELIKLIDLVFAVKMKG